MLSSVFERDMVFAEQLNCLVHPFFGLTGCDIEDSDMYHQTDVERMSHYDDLSVFIADARFPSSGYVDVAELCGGQGLTTKFMIRRGYVGQSMFDIVVGFDVDSPKGKKDFLDYVAICKPYVLVMGPPCMGMKGFKDLKALKG